MKFHWIFQIFQGNSSSFKILYSICYDSLDTFLGHFEVGLVLHVRHLLNAGPEDLLDENGRVGLDGGYSLNVRGLRKKDFTTKAESASRKRKGKREYLNGNQTRHLMKQLNAFFEVIVEVARMRVGKRQTIETLISEEALLLAKFLRDERKTWTPKIAVL